MKFLSEIVYWIVRGLSVFVSRVLFFARVKGKENTKLDEPYILCANHMSIMDPVMLVGAVLSRKAYFMGKNELYKSKVGNWFFRSLKSFPVVRGTADMGAIRSSIKYLNDGYVMMIFPEGTRNIKKDGQLMEFFNGVGIIALNAKCKIVPCYIDCKGGYKLFKRFTINVGEPMDVKELKKQGSSKENLNNIMSALRKNMQKLM